MNKLNEEQLKIVKATEPQVVVCSGAATGKTRTLVARIQYLLDSGADPLKIVAITFTNNAATEILSRLTNSDGIFVGTIHSYCNYLLKKNGISTDTLLANEDFDKLFDLIKNIPEFDIDEVEHLLLDEAQDSNQMQFDFILKTVKPKNWMFFGDWKQSIYEFNSAEPKALIKLTKKPDVTVYHLYLNYRNGENILEFAKKFLAPLPSDFEDISIPVKDNPGKVIESKITLEKAVNYVLSLTDTETYGDWFILCRYNNQIDQVNQILMQTGVPFVNFKQADLTQKQLEATLHSNYIKVLTIHSAKGLESKNVLVLSCWRKSDEEMRIKYVAATRAKDLLIWDNVVGKKKKKKKINKWY